MDTDYGLDLPAIFEMIDTAEVIVFRFVTISSRLLFDPRHNETDGPLLKTAPPAGSMEERFKHLKQLRPRFKLPDKITAIWWPKYVASLESTGVWERIRHRMAAEGYSDLDDMLDGVFRELCRLERTEIYNAIRGVTYQSLWEREG